MSKFILDNRMLEYDLNSLCSNIFCFSTTRIGGVSSGNYSSFNCNEYCGDNVENVFENRKILSKLLPQKFVKFIYPHQTHSTEVLSVDEAFVKKNEHERKLLLEGVDALTTNLKGYCLCISTADCIPVLLFDVKREVVAAIHAGWRGTVNRIVENCINVMCLKYGCNPLDIRACIGPGISLESFEVGDEVYSQFCSKGFDVGKISVKNRSTDKWHIDLPLANELELIRCGVKHDNIECSNICTYKNNDTFYSARRQGIKSGRVLSGIFIFDK